MVLYEIDFDCIQVITAVIAKQVGNAFRVEIRWGIEALEYKSRGADKTSFLIQGENRIQWKVIQSIVHY